MNRRAALPEFHPLTIIRDWNDGYAFRLSDAVTGVIAYGATGSGKTSGIGRHLAVGYLANDFGGIVLCAKAEEKEQWLKWAKETEREADIILFDKSAKYRFNFLEWEASRAGEGGGLTINIVALLDEIAGAIAGDAGKSEGGDENKFFSDALHHLNMNLVDLAIFADLPITLPLLRSILVSAPSSLKDLLDPQWQNGVCATLLREAEQRLQSAPPAVQDDFDECKNYFLKEYPTIGEKTRGIIALSFSMLVRPFITRPLRELFSSDTNIRPEDAFNGKIIIIDLPVQEYRLAGRVAQLTWKYCTQVAIMRRTKPKTGYLRPVFIWADECQNFLSAFDAEYQAVARSAAGCTVYLTQNRESLRRVLGNDDAVDSLVGNLQNKFFSQNGSPDTNKWAAELLGERYVQIASTNVSSSRDDKGGSAGASRSEQKRYYVEPARFTTLRRGGEINDFWVDCIAYKGGAVFDNGNPYKLLDFKQS